jgi:hypothetical protein
MSETQQRALRALTAIRFAVGGASMVAPRASAKLIGLDAEANPQGVYMARLFGARDLMMGYAQAATSGDELQRWLQMGLVVDAADAVSAVAGGVGGYLPKRAAVLGAGVALAAAALGAVAQGMLDR